MPMPSQQGSNLRPSWPFRHPKIKQEVTYGDWLKKKMLVYDVRSRNVYENKQNHDILSHEKSDIYVKLTRILQKIADLEGQFGASGGFGAFFLRKNTARSKRSAGLIGRPAAIHNWVSGARNGSPRRGLGMRLYCAEEEILLKSLGGYERTTVP
jgi:hypothetical protein